jgi:AraC family transcriptional regulator
MALQMSTLRWADIRTDPDPQPPQPEEIDPRVALPMLAAEGLAGDAPSSPPPFTAMIKRDVPGLIEMPARPFTLVCIHVGPSTRVWCRRDGRTYQGLEVHGGVEIIPAGMSSNWEILDAGTTLILQVPMSLLQQAAAASGLDPARIDIVSRFQMRDPQIEHIGWAVKAEIEAGSPGGRLFLDSLGLALATRLLHQHSSRSTPAPVPTRRVGLGGTRLTRLLAHIEDHLDQNLSLADIAAVAGLSASHLKTVFREATGLPVHQYVLRRRVERAQMLLREGQLPINEIALATGFAHQSHLARHMRRLFGVTPAEVKRRG